jgi:hypothetical protein
MDEKIEYKEGDHSDFIIYLFSNDPKPKDSIQLEVPVIEEGKNKHHHTFEQLLMIFVDGLKYFYGNDQGKVTLEELEEDDIQVVNRYFESMNFKVLVSVFPTVFEYQFKYPNYLQEPDKITDETNLCDFFYEVFVKDNVVYRIQFDYLV